MILGGGKLVSNLVSFYCLLDHKRNRLLIDNYIVMKYQLYYNPMEIQSFCCYFVQQKGKYSNDHLHYARMPSANPISEPHKEGL